MINKLKKYWWVFVLLFIFLFSYYIRSVAIVPDRLLSFDPIFQYRFTKYFSDWGHLPVWDELTYYVGREITIIGNAPLMFYLTNVIYWLQPFGWSLLTTCAHASAIYGALIIISAFLLGRELSNVSGGLFSAILVGTAPQILIRTFGSSYDSDQLVLFFLLLTLYLLVYMFKKKTLSSFSLATIGFVAFMLTWNKFSYSFLIGGISLIIYFVLGLLPKWKKEAPKLKFYEKFRLSIKNIKTGIILLICLSFCLVVIGFITGGDFIGSILSIFSFALQAEAKIVNISIAELQPFNIFNIQGWILATGRFVIGEGIMDSFILIVFIFLILFGLLMSYRKNLVNASFLLTLFLIGIYTTFRGVRFTEFTSAMFIILIGVGFGYLIEYSKKDKLLKSFVLGLGILIAIIAISLGSQVGQNLGPDMNINWDSAWEFLKTKTPELSLVGTWWDPGHMIAGTAERRNMADGAHCGDTCFMGINDRITDAGKIMATKDENESIRLIRKYQGNSPKAYWIASDDLIGKFQWCQYFGTGCDARTDPSCPLYMQIPEKSRSFDDAGNIILRNYDMGQQTKVIVFSGQIPIPIFIQGINAALFDEIIVYNNTEAIAIKFTEEEINSLLTGLKPLERQLNIRFTNQTIQMTVWIPRHFSYLVIIPANLRNAVFTKMFMLEGKELNHFKQVFRNEQVKIYEVIL